MSTVNAGWRGPNIVREGLVLYLDAGSGTSYSPYNSGNSWRDISGNTNNGTLTNGPTYSSANGGSIVFDGSNDYAITGNTTLNLSATSNFSYAAWIYPSFDSNLNSGRAIIDFSSAGPTFARSYLRWEGTFYGFYVDIANSSGGCSWWTTTRPTFSANTWHHIVYTHTSANAGQYYFDGVPVATSTFIGLSITAANNKIAVGYGAVNSYYWEGRIAIAQIYTKVLSATEVLQNYNAQKSRFSL
jgi:hypothetical protein